MEYCSSTVAYHYPPTPWLDQVVISRHPYCRTRYWIPKEPKVINVWNDPQEFPTERSIAVKYHMIIQLLFDSKSPTTATEGAKGEYRMPILQGTLDILTGRNLPSTNRSWSLLKTILSTNIVNLRWICIHVNSPSLAVVADKPMNTSSSCLHVPT